MKPGTLVAGKYRIERVIGRGGMGLVCEATHVHLESRVAVKFLAEEMATDQTAIARFTREARASAQLKNEHICRVSDFGVEGKVPYLVMELLVGTDLARLSKVRTLDAGTAALYVKQACLGLAEAHAAKIIHRDLKPGNLFLTRRADNSPLIKILDFGVAKAPSGENEVKLTGTANVVGSPGFMSPEQFRSSKSVDGRTDVWSLGVILYKLVTGRLPFKADNFAEFALAITRDPMPPLEAPPGFEAVVAKCLEKDAAKRYPDVAALGDALTPFAALARSSAPHMTIPPEPSDEPLSGIGGDGPDSVMSTRMVELQVPPPAAASPPTAVSSAAKQTILGVSTPTVPRVPVQQRPTAAETAVPSGTLGGTAVGVTRGGSGVLPRGTVVGEYKIDEKIGEGGMGVVYSATHPMIGKRAAIKVISSDVGADSVLVQRFVQEARSVNQIGHPNIVDVFAFGKLPDGRNYFVMEHLQGESLRAKLTRMFISLDEAIQILDEIAGALEAAHEKGIVHRDLKPDNVYLANVRGGYLMVKLLDFGIAKLAANEGGIAKTSTGEMIGTPAYLSPEQSRGKNVDYRTDIYALGCMMFEMVTGRLPFIAESSMDIVLMHVSKQPQRPSELKPEIPAMLDRLILQTLDKDPARRPSLVEIRNVFAELVASGLVLIEPGSGATFRSDLARRRGDSEGRTPPSSSNTPRPPVVAHAAAPAAATTTGRARTPSDAPTGIAFKPGPDTITPSDQTRTLARPAPKKRRGLAIAFVLVVLLVPAVTIVLAMVNKTEASKTADAAVAVHQAADATAVPTAAPADASAPVDATAEVKPGATLVPIAREVTIRVNVPTAKVEIDGTVVPGVNGVVTVTLADGAHHVVVTASGRISSDKTIEVSETLGVVEIRLERRPKATTTTTNTGSAAPATGSGSGSARPKGDEAIDPFAP